MEHKLILGGGEYLPFARSSIKRLRADGLSYGSRRFEVDGVSITVRIDGEHDYIVLEKNSCVFRMDSGVYSVTTNPRLYDTFYSKAYTANFAKDDPESKSRTLTSEGSKGQAAGQLTLTAVGFKGRIPDEGTALLDKTDDKEQQAVKMAVMALCPASVFTGRCRKYIQAIYGSSLFVRSKPRDLPQLVAETSAAPALLLPAYKSKDDKTEYQDVMVGTSSGVVLDRSGKHWLVNFYNSDQVHVFPLKGNECAEKLRSYLIQNDDGTYKENLSEEDRGHVESYVLSECLPDRANMQTLQLGLSVNQYSMGYGWHWMLSEAKADIVTSESFKYNATESAMRSSHYRAVFAQTDGTWSVVCSVIEGPKVWSVVRSAWCITEPDFQKRVLLKSTPKLGATIECDAPFYAFYRDDTLNVARIKVTRTAASATRSMTPGYSSSTAFNGANTSHTSFGLEDGWLEDRSLSADTYIATVSVGGYSTPDMPLLRTEVIARTEVTAKEWPGRLFALGYFSDIGQWLNQSFPYGSPLEGGGYAMSPPVDCVQVKTGWQGKVTYSLNSKNTTVVTKGSIAVVVPTFDAEAIYCWSSKDTQESGTAMTSRWGAGYIGQSPIGMNGTAKQSEPWVEWIFYQSFNAGPGNNQQVITAAEYSSVNSIANTTAAKMICKAGISEARFTTVQEFFDNTVDEVGQRFPTWSGTQTEDKAVVLSGNADPIGFDRGTSIDTPAVVGWV